MANNNDMINTIKLSGVVALALLVSACAQQPPSTPNPIHKASDVRTQIKSKKFADGSAGSLAKIQTPDGVEMLELHVYGSAHQMGYAHGYLLGEQMNEFLNKAMPEFFISEIDSLPLSKLPEWLQKAIEEFADKDATKLFEFVLGLIYQKEEQYVKASRSGAVDESRGMAEGGCASGAFGDPAKCDVDKLFKQILNLNMLPELIKMTCSMFGAYGKATPSGKLVQLRTLDFGGGPFANYSVINVRHPSVGNDFMSVSFPCFTGVVTGVSTKVALSEKVWETYTGTGVQPGHYDGEPVALVIRDMLQFSNNRMDAIKFASGITRTWAVFLGVGDVETQEFNALGYREKDLEVFSPENVTDVTHMPVFDGLVYIDKHPQPSHDNITLPSIMKKYYGKITGRGTAQNVPRLEGSGDLHIAVYDFENSTVYVSIGKVDGKGNYGPNGNWRACFRPFIEFDWKSLFSHPAPTA